MIRKLLLLSLCAISLTAMAKRPKSSGKDAAKSEQTKPKESDYDKLFKDAHKQAQGMFTLHDLKGKLYIEIPTSMFGREFLLGSTISEISDNASGTIGSKSDYPLHIILTRNDRFVQLRQVNCENIVAQSESSANLESAVRQSNSDPILRNYKIEAYNKDSSTVVIDATELFISDVEELSPFSQYGMYSGYTIKKTFQKDRSMLGEIKAFDDNVVIRSTLSYVFTLSNRAGTKLITDKPLTAVMTRSIVLLPEQAYQPRRTDSRMSVFPTGKIQYSAEEQRAKVIYYANRWRVEPSDAEAYMRGETVDVKQPIVFYVDNYFPEKWKKHIFEAVNQWNEPFEAIGLRNAITARNYPTDDPSFDPDNIKYSCIRYAPIPIANAMGPSWVDPRSGEILNASVYVYHDVMKLLNNWMFIQTSQADPRVRKVTLPDEIMGDGLRYVIAHEVGHCLGYMHNMSASAVIPVDSLRSPSFTQNQGTTTSIMDYARFNYVAQPGDMERGVKLTPPRFGAYDYYAVKWLYKPLPQCKSADEEYAITSKWITEASADSVFRYGKQQFRRSLDPKSQSEDLGDDAVRASEYGVRNLKYILSNMNNWFAEDDPTFAHRSTIYDGIIMQYVRYINHVMANVGGIYLNEKLEGDPVESYRAVPRERQREALQFVLNQLKDIDWLDNDTLIRNLPLMGSPKSALIPSIVAVAVAAPERVALSSAVAGSSGYTPEECRKDVYNFVWSPTLAGKTPTKTEMTLQREYVKSLTTSAGLKYTGTGAMKSKKLTDEALLIETPDFLKEYAKTEDLLTATCDCAAHDLFDLKTKAQADKAPISGYSSPYIRYYDPYVIEADYYTEVIRLRDMLRSKVAKASPEAKGHYQLLLRNIEIALKK